MAKIMSNQAQRILKKLYFDKEILLNAGDTIC